MLGCLVLSLSVATAAHAGKRADGRSARAGSHRAAAPAGPPVDREAAERLRSELGHEFYVRHTPHFRIAYNTGIEFADFHGDLFEAVYRSFRDFFEKSGFALEPPGGRLEVVLFDSREQFTRYAAARNPEAQRSGGFYSSRENRIAFFDSLSDEHYRRTSQKLESVEESIRARRAEIGSLERTASVTFTYADGRSETYPKKRALAVVAEQQRDLREERRRIRAFYEDRNLSTTIHECVHQLAYNLGVQSLRADNPKLLGEGLATYFETMGYTDLGPTGNRNPTRFKAYRAAREAGRLYGLEQLLTRDDLFDVNGSAAETAYAQSWALVQYLFDEHAEAFLDYLRAAARPRSSDTSAERWRVRLFSRSFGEDLPGFEKKWRAYMRRFD